MSLKMRSRIMLEPNEIADNRTCHIVENEFCAEKRR